MTNKTNPTRPQILTGYDAIEYARAEGLPLHKYADPTEDSCEGLTVEEAEEVAAEDPSLIWAAVYPQREGQPSEFPEGMIDLRYGAERSDSGYRPVFALNGRRTEVYVPHPMSEEDAIATARAEAHCKAARYVGDWDITVSPDGSDTRQADGAVGVDTLNKALLYWDDQGDIAGWWLRYHDARGVEWGEGIDGAQDASTEELASAVEEALALTPSDRGTIRVHRGEEVRGEIRIEAGKVEWSAW